MPDDVGARCRSSTSTSLMLLRFSCNFAKKSLDPKPEPPPPPPFPPDGVVFFATGGRGGGAGAFGMFGGGGAFGIFGGGGAFGTLLTTGWG